MQPLSKEAAFYTLLGAVYDQLPKRDFANQMIAAGSQVPATTLITIREGKSRDLATLIFAVEKILPDTVIPEAVLETAKTLS